MPNDTASQPKATVGEPAGLASCAQGPAHNHESHAGASEYKVRKASTVRFPMDHPNIFYLSNADGPRTFPV